MAKKTTEQAVYDNRSIQQLKGADRVRKRPAVIFGSDGLDGCEHAFFEILSNSVDEAREGYGSVITVRVQKDGTMEVTDRGRGVPLDYNENEQQWNWYLIFCELYAGGKYKNNEEDAAYEFSLGLNGLGACATQCASEFMYVRSCDGKTVSEIDFAKGEPISELRKRPCGRGEGFSGTTIRWRPDLEVFKAILISKEHYIEVLKQQAVVNSGIRFEFFYEEADGSIFNEVYYYENGIIDRVTELAGAEVLTSPKLYKTETVGRDRADLADYRLKYEMAFVIAKDRHVKEYYHNSSFLEHGGSPDDAAQSAFVSAFDKYLRENGKYKKDEKKITFQDIDESLVLVINSFSTQTSYANQTKKAITNEFIKKSMTDSIKRWLEIFFAENPLDAERATSQVMINKRSREAAYDTKVNIAKKLSGTMDLANRVEKFVNCRSKDASLRELYIVEGDSAMTSCKLARNPDFQAIMPVRGKTLNCLKSSYDKIFSSDIIVDLLRVIGCGVELEERGKSRAKGKGADLSIFDLERLKWNKIIICTDADEDGFQIRVLILTMFYRLLPTLLHEGRVYIAESPLFEINTKDETYFAYDEKEKVEILKKLDEKKQKYTIQRSKGLGENEPDMMSKTTMNPASRRLIRICEDDAEKTADMFDIMLGENADRRRDYIARYGAKYLSQADI